MSYISSKFQIKFNNAFVGGFFAVLLMTGTISANVAQASEITASSVIKLVNEARKEANIQPVKENALLQKAAEKKAQDMIDNNYFAHTSPQGKTPWDFITDSGYNYRFAGENLAINYTDTKEQQKAWMDSPLHRKNILNSDYVEIGVAVKSGVIDGNKTIVTVQEFGAQMTRVLAESTVAKPQNNVAIPSLNIEQKKSAPVSMIVSSKNPTAKSFIASNTFFDEVSQQLRLGQIFENKKLTLAGWIIIFVFSIVVTLIDMFILLHNRNKHHFAVPESENHYL